MQPVQTDNNRTHNEQVEIVDFKKELAKQRAKEFYDLKSKYITQAKLQSESVSST